MITVTEEALSELCVKIGINKGALEYLGGGRGDSDGIVYTFTNGIRKMALKIIAIPKQEKETLDRLDLRIRYAGFLGKNGVRIAAPIRNRNGNLYEWADSGNHRFVAYEMEFKDGRNPGGGELTDELVRNWGKLTGKSHRITKQFQQGTDIAGLNHKAEIEFFRNWCKEPEVKQEWTKMERLLDTLPCGADEYGFIHNDNHQQNILVSGNEITLIDFDCAARQFFIQDIATPVQGLMFGEAGGMASPVRNRERLERFFDSFLNGYETENHLSDFWYQKLGIFVQYRRVLLFTCMQDWINTQPDLKDGFMNRIRECRTEKQ